MEVLAGARLTPLKLTLFTALAMPLCFLIGLSSDMLAWCAAGFVFGFGAINGLVTIVKATLPWNCLVQSAMPAAPGCCLFQAN